MEQIEAGKLAAGSLLDLFRYLLHQRASSRGENLLTILAQMANNVGIDNENIIAANGIGFLSQTYEATAGLIGNTLLALGVNSEIRELIEVKPSMLINVVDEVIRFDPPVQNTRRFVVQDEIVAGQKMKAGDAILVVLAAANRDQAINPKPEQFDIFRESRRSFTFGASVHACPGQTIASTIALVAVEALLASGIKVQRLSENVSYRSSVNARIPMFSN